VAETAEQVRAIAAELARLAELCRVIERKWFVHRLEAAQIGPGQLPDGLLVEDTTRFTKGSAGMKFFGRTSRVERASDGLVVEATVKFAGIAPDRLRRAFRKIGDIAVDQMTRVDLPAAGRVLSAVVREDAGVAIRALITDAAAAAKALETIYSGLLVELAGDGIDQISLIDTPLGFAKAAGDGTRLICKIFDGREIEVTPLQRALKKCEDQMQGKTVRLTPDERAALLSQPAVAQRMAELSRIELSTGDAQKQARATENALFLIKMAQRSPIQNDPRFSLVGR
jgi:hypothetical protein